MRLECLGTKSPCCCLWEKKEENKICCQGHRKKLDTRGPLETRNRLHLRSQIVLERPSSLFGFCHGADVDLLLDILRWDHIVVNISLMVYFMLPVYSVAGSNATLHTACLLISLAGITPHYINECIHTSFVTLH